MFFPVLVGCVIGAVMMGRTKPQTKSFRRELIGPVTGLTYKVDDLPNAGIIIVHGPGCVCAFARQPGGGFAFVQAMGHAQGVRAVVSDLNPALLKGTTNDPSSSAT